MLKSLHWTGQEKFQFNNWRHAYWIQLYHLAETLRKAVQVPFNPRTLWSDKGKKIGNPINPRKHQSPEDHTPHLVGSINNEWERPFLGRLKTMVWSWLRCRTRMKKQQKKWYLYQKLHSLTIICTTWTFFIHRLNI